MKYKKYRELEIEPNQINFKNIKVLEILNYMPAGNDVIECEILFNGCIIPAIIKVERSKMADFKSEINNLNILNNNLLYNKLPIIYEYGEINNKMYLVLEKMKGNRLSYILKKNQKYKNLYLEKYGEELGIIHQIDISNFPIAKQRIINDIPKSENYNIKDSKITDYLKYLNENKPEINYDTFIHGDFHYANILWLNHNISAVIDWEYSGKGFKEQDIAWALILRNGQLFMDNINDIHAFLEGYKKTNTYDDKNLKWCIINGYLHFYLMNNDVKYKNKILKLLKIVSRW
jgi:aminoglycoside phosphotransferase (APT) family kinase protein